jgi:hypothetical protein
VFALKRQGFNLRRGAVLVVILGLLIIVGVLSGERGYFLSAICGALLLTLSDPCGEYAHRVARLAMFAVAGALLTALGFGIGGGAWRFAVLAAFVVTLLTEDLPRSLLHGAACWTAASMAATGAASVAVGHPFLGALELTGGSGPDGAAPSLLFCENETNTARLFGAEPVTPYPKDGINDHVISGAATVNPGRTGTKCAFWYQVAARAHR